MSAYVIFDVDIRDPAKYQEFMNGVKPALEKAGCKYLVRGGAHKVYEGDWQRAALCFWNFPPWQPGKISTTDRPTEG
jgi:uncharacterized protein (DUF1330 family)